MSFSIQTSSLRQTEHQIHALHRLTARAFDEVIDRAHDHNTMRALVDLPRDVDVSERRTAARSRCTPRKDNPLRPFDLRRLHRSCSLLKWFCDRLLCGG